jgi:sugar phosphate isomerase/epimerase
MDVSRVTACSFPLKEKDLDYTFQVISESGFDKIDLVGRMPHFSVTDPAYDMDELRRVVEKYGVRLANIGSYCGRGFSDESEDERQAAMDEMKKTLDVAKEFGAKSIRIFPGDGTLASMDKVVPYFKESAAYAETVGVYMGIENHGGEISGNPEACREISEKVGSPYFGILYEPCNLMAAGAEYKSAFESFKDHIVHVHIKDGKYNDDGKWERCMLGDGEIDYTWVWDQVEALGYDRDYALEFEVGNIEPVETGYKKWLDTWAKL